MLLNGKNLKMKMLNLIDFYIRNLLSSFDTGKVLEMMKKENIKCDIALTCWNLIQNYFTIQIDFLEVS